MLTRCFDFVFRLCTKVSETLLHQSKAEVEICMSWQSLTYLSRLSRHVSRQTTKNLCLQIERIQISIYDHEQTLWPKFPDQENRYAQKNTTPRSSPGMCKCQQDEVLGTTQNPLQTKSGMQDV